MMEDASFDLASAMNRDAFFKIGRPRGVRRVSCPFKSERAITAFYLGQSDKVTTHTKRARP